MHILSLPSVMLEQIFSFLTYDQVAKYRVVCKDFDSVCQRVLNRGFQIIERQLSFNLRAIKTQLPRRESERRFHPLARHCDILTSVETRISMLSMAYSRYIEQGKCCFIPGKILDEMRHVMAIVDQSDPLPMAFEVLQELRDISGMAIEHFEERVAPTLRQKIDDYSSRMLPISILRGDVDKKAPKSAAGTSLEMALLREACLRNNKSLLKIEKKNRILTKKMELVKRLMTLNKQQLIQKQIEQNHKIAELKRKVDDYEIKFNEFSRAGFHCIKDAESLNKSSLLSKSSKSFLKMRLKNFGSQIKLDPSYSNIGLNKARRGSPIIKPRRASLSLPSYKPFEDLTDDSCYLDRSANKTVNTNVNKKSAEYSSNNALAAFHQQLLKETFDVTKNNKRKDKLSNIEGKKIIAHSLYRESSPIPGTSKDNFSDNNDSLFIRGRKRSYSEHFDQNSTSQNESTKGFQAKVQVLSRTMMKLIESLSDNSNIKRRRLNKQE